MAIALTYLERWPGGPHDTVSLIDRHGELVLTYAKVNTCDARPGRGDVYAGRQLSGVYTGDGARAGQGGSHDLLRPGVSRERTAAHAWGSRAHPGSQCVRHGTQFHCPGANQSHREHGRHRASPTMPRRMPMGIPSPLIPLLLPSKARVIAWSWKPGNRKESPWRPLIWMPSARTGRASRGAMPSGSRTATAGWSSSASKTRSCG